MGGIPIASGNIHNSLTQYLGMQNSGGVTLFQVKPIRNWMGFVIAT